MANAWNFLYPTVEKPNVPLIQQRLGVHFWNRTLLKTALTHSSYLNEHAVDQLECNERLELLGDAALDLAIANALYKGDPELKEGAMTLIRSAVVNDKTLSDTARRLGIGEQLLMGSGETKSGGANRNSNLANAFEAIVGAIFLEKGYNAVQDFCVRILKDEINDAYDKVTASPKQSDKLSQTAKPKQSKKPAATNKSKRPSIGGKHPKTALQEISQAKYSKTPSYGITKATGKSNAMTFTAQVRVGGKMLGTGNGSSKKDAETAAAKAALASLAGYA